MPYVLNDLGRRAEARKALQKESFLATEVLCCIFLQNSILESIPAPASWNVYLALSLLLPQRCTQCIESIWFCLYILERLTLCVVCWWGGRNFSPAAVQGANGAEQHFQTFDSSDLCACTGDSIITMYERATVQIYLQLEEITQYTALSSGTLEMRYQVLTCACVCLQETAASSPSMRGHRAAAWCCMQMRCRPFCG